MTDVVRCVLCSEPAVREYRRMVHGRLLSPDEWVEEGLARMAGTHVGPAPAYITATTCDQHDWEVSDAFVERFGGASGHGVSGGANPLPLAVTPQVISHAHAEELNRMIGNISVWRAQLKETP